MSTVKTFKALHKNILFQFEDELVTAKGVKQFKEKTSWGFDLGANIDQGLNRPRWVKVLAVGHKVVDVKVGMRVLVEPLKWTEGVTYGVDTVWLTDEDHVLAVDDSVHV